MSWLILITENPFYELAVIIFLAALLGAAGQFLKQPLIVMFIALGILVGPSVLHIVRSNDNIHLLGEVGIAILLFIVGLKLDIRLIKTTGKVALTTGLGQVLFTSVIGYLIGLLLGLSNMHSFYVAVALTFSSTIIIVKLLSDKKEIDSLHGQIAIGFLIVQDIVIIVVMIVLSAMGRSQDGTTLADVLRTAGSTIALIIIAIIMMKWVIPKISFFLAKSQELLALFAVAWAVSLASVSEIIGFSSEVGAFLAGVSLASSPFKETISSRLVSLRDFLLLFFFVNLGTNLNLAIIGSQIPAALALSAFVLIGNPIVVLIIMGIMGYRKRTSFLAGLTVAQISEFSLIFAGLGLQLGHIDEETVGLITLVGLITIGASTYLIIYSYHIYEILSPLLNIFERKNPYSEADTLLNKNKKYDVILFGLGRFGSKIADYLDQHPEISYLGISFDPQAVESWQNKGKDIIYGDIEDPEILEKIPYEHSKCVVSTIPEYEHSVRLIKSLNQENYKGKIFVTATQERDYDILKECNVDEILIPHHMAAENFYNSYLAEIL